MKFISFGHDPDAFVGIDMSLQGQRHAHVVPERWIPEAEADAMIDKKLKEKTFLGTPKYASRLDAEKDVVNDLYWSKTGVSKTATSGEFTPQPPTAGTKVATAMVAATLMSSFALSMAFIQKNQ